MGTLNVVKNVNITEVSKVLGESAASALIGCHVFTGCDSVSCLKNKGKTKALDLMLENADVKAAFSQLGVEWEASPQLCAQLERVVCRLYGEAEATDIDAVRHSMFCRDLRTEDVLPPTKDCLLQHIKRSNYQAGVYRRCLKQKNGAPSPVGHGWKLVDGALQIVWMTLPAVPADLVNQVTCGCAKSACKSPRCSCQAAGVPCTTMCK